MNRRISVYKALGICLALSTSACLKDIRPDSIQESVVPEDKAQKAEDFVERAMLAHGGLKEWQAKGVARYVFRDYWPATLAKWFAMPWEFEGQRLELIHETAGDNGYIRFLQGERRNQIWGIQNWVTYTRSGDDDPIFAQDDTIKFWVPTVNYFMALPFRIHEADVKSYAGKRQLGDREFHLVYCTWHQAAPQENVDQYILWVNAVTDVIEYVEYTVRDFGGRTSGVMWYSDWQTVEGIRIPFLQTVISEPGNHKDPLHYFKLETVEFDLTPDPPLVPDPERAKEKYSKT